jgi:hypothetical protein
MALRALRHAVVLNPNPGIRSLMDAIAQPARDSAAP